VNSQRGRVWRKEEPDLKEYREQNIADPRCPMGIFVVRKGMQSLDVSSTFVSSEMKQSETFGRLDHQSQSSQPHWRIGNETSHHPRKINSPPERVLRVPIRRGRNPLRARVLNLKRGKNSTATAFPMEN
jgi:hypothetical protein